MVPRVCLLVHVGGLSDEQPLEEAERGDDSNWGYRVCDILPTAVSAAWLNSSDSVYRIG